VSLTAGTRLGPYEILAPLGTGGMGEVYSARDTRLDRTVAIKILPAQFSADPVRKQRFEREAKTISSLNHPHICTLHDVGSHDGVGYLVMECVEGETLAKRVEKGPLSLEQVLKYGAQIADALDKAHRSGVVHRDLKPGNIMLTQTGAKLLDFGLAKPAIALASVATMTAAVTQSSPMTEQGAIVGTFQYMSPEQVEGKELDGRSDIFSFGAVLYEMLTGQRAFQGKSQLSVASAILEKEPEPLTSLKPMMPAALEHAIQRCLAKDPEERWQTARDLALELKWIADLPAQRTGSGILPARLTTTGSWGWFLAGVLLVALVASWVVWRGTNHPQESMEFYVPVPFSASDVTLSPDGRTLSMVVSQETTAKHVIWVHEIGKRGARRLADTEGASYPFWSADSKSLAFFADGKLKKLEVAGGPVQSICDAPSGRGGAWNKDGVIIFTPDARLGGLYRVAASGGTPAQISSPDTAQGELSHRWPVFLPDQKHFLFLAANFSGRWDKDAIYAGALDSDEKRFVVAATANAAYAAPGYLLFYRDKTLLAQKFDTKSLTLSGAPATLLSDLQYMPQTARVLFTVADNGFLIAQSGGEVSVSQLEWFDRKGKATGDVGKRDVYGNVFVAPEGKRISVDIVDMAAQNTDVWTQELQSEKSKRLTFEPSIDVVPVWSPDGKRVVFSSNRLTGFNLYVKNADGAEEEKLIAKDEIDKLPNDWSRDGKTILYTHGKDLWYLTLPDLKTAQFLKAPSVLRNGQFSPDGKWVAYASNETGKWQIYVTSFPDARGKWQVSTSGGEQPRWRGDGKELFYMGSDGKMMAAPVTTGANFDAGTPAALFQAGARPAISSNDTFDYDVSRDGQRFLIITQAKTGESQPISVIVNWSARLNK
jgi:serine/threonine protein kinase/Tol biopolymer transport system component